MSCVIGVTAFAVILSIPFLEIPTEWALIVLGGAVFVGMQGVILYMVATF